MTTQHRILLTKAGLFSVTACVTASLLIIVLALPPFQIGIWGQSEGVLGALHLLAGIAAIGLIPLTARNKRRRQMLFHPFVLLSLGLAAWILVTGPMQPVPRLAWFGSQQIGEGLFWFLDLAVLLASSMMLMRYSKIRKFLALVALLVALSLVGATMHATYLVGASNLVTFTPYVPYYFPDYLAFFGVFIVIILISCFRLKKPGLVLATCCLGAAIVIASSNRAAIVFVFAMAPIAWLLLQYGPWSGHTRRWLAVTGAFLVPLAVTLIVLMVDYTDMISGGGTLSLIGNSALSRQRLIEIAVTAAARDPSIALFGNGWGSYSDLLAIHLPIDWAPLRKDQVFANSWDAVFRVDFHSHNYLVEGLFSSGIVGMLLVLAFTAALPGWSWRRHVVMAGTLGALTGGLSATWFQLPGSMPFMALAWAGLAAPTARTHIRSRGPALIVMGLIGGGLLYGGLSSLQYSDRAFFFTPRMEAPLYREAERTRCAVLFTDQGRGGVHLAHRLRTYVKYMVKSADEDDPLSSLQIDRLRGMICAAEEYVDRKSTFRLLLATLFARADLAFSPSGPELAPLLEDYFSNWGERVDQALSIAPKRTDLAASYLLWLLREEKEGAFSKFSRDLYRDNPEDAVALWFSGIALLGDTAGSDEGLARMQKSLDKGIERIFPIDEGLKSQFRP